MAQRWSKRPRRQIWWAIHPTSQARRPLAPKYFPLWMSARRMLRWASSYCRHRVQRDRRRAVASLLKGCTAAHRLLLRWALACCSGCADYYLHPLYRCRLFDQGTISCWPRSCFGRRAYRTLRSKYSNAAPPSPMMCFDFSVMILCCHQSQVWNWVYDNPFYLCFQIIKYLL